MRHEKLRIFFLSGGGRSDPPAPSGKWDIEPSAIGPDPKSGQAGVINGMVIAQAGEFKTEGRGAFDEGGLREIQSAWPHDGAVCGLQHATVFDDRLLFHVGRVVSPKRHITGVTNSKGAQVSVACLRGDLILDLAAKESPSGDLPRYLLARCKSDPKSLSSSLVLSAEMDYGGNRGGPPLWHVGEIYGDDIVAVGDAVDGLLGAGGFLGARRLLRERLEHTASAATPQVICGRLLLPSGEPSFNETRQLWELISPSALTELGQQCLGVPIVANGETIALIGEGGARLENDGGGWVVKLTTAANGLSSRAYFQAVVDMSAARREWQPYHNPGHRLHGHKADHLVGGLRLSRIEAKEPGCFA